MRTWLRRHPKVSAWIALGLAMALLFLGATRSTSMTELQRFWGCLLIAAAAGILVRITWSPSEP